MDNVKTVYHPQTLFAGGGGGGYNYLFYFIFLNKDPLTIVHVHYFIRLLESIISRHATSKISLLYIVSVAEGTGLKLALSETPKTGFVGTRPKRTTCIKRLFWPPL